METTCHGGHGQHRVTAPGHSGHSDSHVTGHGFHGASRVTRSSECGDLSSIERSPLQSSKRAYRERATSASRADGARAVGPGTARETTCHGGHCLHGACHVVTAVTSPITAFTAPVTSITAMESGQRAGIPRRRRSPRQWLHQGKRAGQKASAIDTNQYELEPCYLLLVHA